MENNQTIDARGLSCPQPALLTRKTLSGVAGGVIEVLVDCGTARDNVRRTAERAGWRASVESLSDGSFRLVLEK